MGGYCCSRDKSAKCSLSLHEKANIKIIFDDLSNKYEETSGQGIICEKAFIEFFLENPPLGSKLFRFMMKNSFSGKVDLNTYLSISEILLKEPDNNFFKLYKTVDKTDIFGLVSMNKWDSNSPEAMRNLFVIKTEAREFMKDVLRIFNSENLSYKIEDIHVNSVVDHFFHLGGDKIDWKSFMYYLKQNLRYLNDTLKCYFTFKFLTYSVPFQIPKLNLNSFILKKETLALFHLSNSAFHSTESLVHLYSAENSKIELVDLAQSLISFKGPTIILIQHKEEVDSNEKFVFGAFNPRAWQNSTNYQGSKDTQLFSIYPYFKNYYTEKRITATDNYCFMNLNEDSDFKFGIGFGGNSYKSAFRLWLDGHNMQYKSQTMNEDSTFESGFLVDQYVQNLKITYVEAWGLSFKKSGNENIIISTSELENKILKLNNMVDLRKKPVGHLIEGNMNKDEGKFLYRNEVPVKTGHQLEVERNFFEYRNTEAPSSIKVTEYSTVTPQRSTMKNEVYYSVLDNSDSNNSLNSRSMLTSLPNQRSSETSTKYDKSVYHVKTINPRVEEIIKKYGKKN